jgi:hypothetical protein
MELKKIGAVLSLVVGMGFIVGSEVAISRRVLASPAQDTSNRPTRYLYLDQELKEPRSQSEIDWLLKRKALQLKQAQTYAPFHDFKFVDRLQESGITFKNSVVDDAMKNYKADHYDHGNGIAVADVDGAAGLRTSPNKPVSVSASRSA